MTKHKVDHDAIREKMRHNGQDPECWKEFYDDWAGKYDAVFESVNWITSKTCRIAELMAKHVPLDNKVLDVACGTGLSGENLRKVGFTKVDGHDISMTSIEVAKEKVYEGKPIYDNFKTGLIAADKKIDDIPDHYYDSVTCSGAINQDHIRVGDALTEFHRIVKPNGYAVFTAKSHAEVPFLSTIEDMMQEKKIELISAERQIYHTEGGFNHYCYCCVIKMVPVYN